MGRDRVAIQLRNLVNRGFSRLLCGGVAVVMVLGAPGPAACAESASGAAAGPVHAVPPATTATQIAAALPFRIFGKSYLRLGYSAAGTEFALDRLYVSVDWRLWDSGNFKLNLEGGDFRDRDYTLASGATSLTTRDTVFNVKTRAAYLEVLFPAVTLQVGQIGLPWAGYVDGLWGYRVLGTNFLDQSGYLGSVDLGLTLSGKIPASLGDWSVSVANGESWKSPELGYHKDYHARVTLLPLAPVGLNGLFVSGAGSMGTYDPVITGSTGERNRWIAQLGYRVPGQYLASLDYLISASDPASRMVARYPSLAGRGTAIATGTGLSAYGTLNLGVLGGPGLRPLELLARVDQLDPDTHVADNGLLRQTLGLSYNWNPALMTVLAYTATTYQAGAQLANDQRGMLSTEVRY